MISGKSSLGTLLFAAGAALALAGPASLQGAEGRKPSPGCRSGSCHTLGTVPRYAHDPFVRGRCTACHRPSPTYDQQEHTLGSFEEGGEGNLCLSCHRHLGEALKSSAAHEALREGGCLSCHVPHGGRHPALLRSAFPLSIYAAFEEDGYDLCWECHDPSLATEKFTDGSTGFRMGRRNFHYSHLHKRKGMTCLACHDPHASLQDSLIRPSALPEETPWKLSLTFDRTPGQGRCRGGCHVDLTYRR